MLFKLMAFKSLFFFVIIALQSAHSNGQEQAAAEEQTPAKPMNPAGSENITEDSEHIWLQSGNKKVRGLYRPETTGKTHGGALLIPDMNRKPDMESLVNSLREALPDGHWYTLALDLTSPMLSEKEIQQVIDSGVKHFHNQGVFNIALIGIGIGGTHAIHYVADLPPAPAGKLQTVRALVLVDANNKIPMSETKTLEKIALINIPLLDAYTVTDISQQERTQIRKRARYKKIKGDAIYQQVKLPPVVNLRNSYENRVTKRIRGWLDKNAAGLMVN